MIKHSKEVKPNYNNVSRGNPAELEVRSDNSLNQRPVILTPDDSGAIPVEQTNPNQRGDKLVQQSAPSLSRHNQVHQTNPRKAVKYYINRVDDIFSRQQNFYDQQQALIHLKTDYKEFLISTE